tara:strand:- start:21 stop:374 length:354 start_codon:yes stop_codon:yes gene_type:complete
MTHFAKVENGIVTEVIVAEQEFVDKIPGEWVQTSYNTRGGIHYAPNSHDPDNGIALRKNWAGVGYTYDHYRDAFFEPKPFASWKLNEETCIWEAPIPYPDDGNLYVWNEETQLWDLV